MSRDRTLHCCLCGEPRRPTQKPVEGFSNNVECISIGKHRDLKPMRWEDHTQLLVSVSMWRNGGTASGQTHICDGCIIVGLRAAKLFVDRALTELGSSEPLGPHYDGTTMDNQKLHGGDGTVTLHRDRALSLSAAVREGK